jgi:hypothetical protein
MTQPWVPPSGNEWVDVTLLKRIGLGHELTFEEGDLNKTDAENSINWLGRKVMELLETTAWSTGDMKTTISTVVPNGWLLVDNRTIGSSSSGASVTGDIYEQLFNFIWAFADNSYLLTSAGGSTTKGASSDADWTANKRIHLPKIMGRALVASGQGSGLTNRVLGTQYGTESITYTPSGSVSQASIGGITATCGSIGIGSLTASVSTATATSSAIIVTALKVPSTTIDISGLGISVTLNNGAMSGSGTANVTGATCSNAAIAIEEPVSVIDCTSPLVVDIATIAGGITSDVSVATQGLTGTASLPEVSISGTIPTPTITVAPQTATIGGSIPSPTITIGGSIATQTYSGEEATLSVSQPSFVANYIIKV